MTITNFNDAESTAFTKVIVFKNSVTGLTSGSFYSLWNVQSVPAIAGYAPATASPCNTNVTGCISFPQQPAGNTSYLYEITSHNTNSLCGIEIHDRLAHKGSLSGTVVGAQTVNLNLNDFLDRDNIDHRKGDANFSDVQWWLEWYIATGASTPNIVVTVQFNDGSTANLTSIGLLATRPASFLQPLNGNIQAADAGKFIRSVNTVHFSATTGTVGNFGVTATRQRAVIPTHLANKTYTFDWASLGLPEVANNACLFPITQILTTSTGVLSISGKMIHG